VKRATYKMLLARARELIEDGWTKGASARTKNGKVVDPSDPKAVRFCLIGSLIRARRDLNASPPVYWKAIDTLLDTRDDMPHGLAAWQDKYSRKKSEVLDLFDEAIK
jgi:hypothetical protein